MKKRMWFGALAGLLLSMGLIGCGSGKKEEAASQNVEVASESTDEQSEVEETKAFPEVVILYTNDIHTYIDNATKDDDGNEVRLLSYASVAGLRASLEAEGKNVILVDAGDHIQGTAYGGLDEGATMIELMNQSGYQLATLGNHEFDYGQFRVFQIMEEAKFPYISCNFTDVRTGDTVLDSYRVFEIDGAKIAFVGISTPETITKSTPIYFQDESGNKIYDFCAEGNGQELYDAVQKAIDAASAEADFVVALAHLGVDPASEPYRSTDVIAHTRGLDAVIDGHSHSLVESEMVKDVDGNDVLLTQTGSYLARIGKMTIASDGSISTEMIEKVDEIDENVKAIEDNWMDNINTELGRVVAKSELEFCMMNPENPEERLIRRMETNLGDLVADSIYYYYNETKGLDCDIAIVNGGGIRADIPVGDCSYLTAKQVNPFGNVMCLIEAKGQNIIDALEMGAAPIGLMDEKSGAPAESGGFLHVAGIKYDLDTTIESTIQKDTDGNFVGEPTAEYKVKNVEIYNKETGAYEAIDPEEMYSVGGINYLLRNSGSGLTMFSDCEPIVDYDEQDYLVFANYLMSFTPGEDGIPVINTANSPLSSYAGYMLDYDAPHGVGRINVIVQ